MNPYLYQKLVQEIDTKKTIESHCLKYISSLKNCGHWDAVQELGYLKYQGRYANYDGLIVHYQQSIYYLPKQTMKVLEPFRKWISTPSLTVIEKNESETTLN